MSKNNVQVPDNPDEFVKWMRETSRPVYAKPSEADADGKDAKASKRTTRKELEDFDIDSINTNILGTNEEAPATSTADVTNAAEKKADTLNDTDVIKERIQAKLAMFDDVEANRNAPVAKSENEEVIETTNATMTADAAIVNNMAEVTNAEVEPMKKNSESKNEPPPQTPQPATPKASRISAKMRKATRDEFHDAYLVKTDTKGGSPITIAPDVLQFAYRVCSVSGDHRARPTYLINNLLREIFKGLEADIQEWSKLD